LDGHLPDTLRGGEVGLTDGETDDSFWRRGEKIGKALANTIQMSIHIRHTTTYSH
jgi:hypothetical protein